MQLGDIHIDRINEMAIPFMTPAAMFPDAPVEAIEQHRHWLQALKAKGIDPAQVDYVFCTHLHGDHGGWNTQWLDGRWVPTFQNATYLIADAELQHVAAANSPAYQESVLPVIEAGLVKTVTSDFMLDDQVWLEPTPGHTPGHVAVHLCSGQQRAVLCGDLIHSPLQCHHPEWRYWIDSDPAGHHHAPALSAGTGRSAAACTAGAFYGCIGRPRGSLRQCVRLPFSGLNKKTPRLVGGDFVSSLNGARRLRRSPGRSRIRS